MAQFSFLLPGDAGNLTDDVRALLDELDEQLPREHRAFSGQCQPALDVFETSAAVEVALDAAGLTEEALRVLVRNDMLLIVGEKAPSAAGGERTFHLVEREFGRFARVVRLSGAFDVSHARATLQDGELKIVLPKRTERRGGSRRIAISSGVGQQE
jgi:HSP20 family protein